MNNTTALFKRAGAYIIDLTIILLISSLISSVPFINKQIESYQETFDKYEIEYKEYINTMNLLNESYEDKILTEEEFDKFSDLKHKELIAEKYDNLELTEEEYKDIIEQINDEYTVIVEDYQYLLNKNSTTNTIIILICTILYFGVLQYFLNGQTVGKKLLKLQVVSATDQELNISNYLLRSLIVNDILLNTIGTFYLISASQQVYIEANNIISNLIRIINAIIIFMVLTRQDTRALHDLLFGTKVISTLVKQDEPEGKDVELKEVKNKTKPNIKSTTEKK